MTRRTRMDRSGMALLGAVVLLAATGCSAEPEPSNEGGPGLPVAGWLTDPPSGETAIDGTLRVADNGCFHLDTADGDSFFVVWPDGFEHNGATVLADDGSELADGDPVRGTGTVLEPDAVVASGGGEDSAMGAMVGFCLEDDENVALLTRTVAR